MRITVILCGLGLGVGLVAGACKPGGSQDTEPGTSDEGDTETCTPGAEGCICGADASCEPGLLCASGRCIVNDSVTTSGTIPPTTTTSEDTGDTGNPTETSGHTMGVTDTGDSECDPAMGVTNPACDDPAAPYCGAGGVCVGCPAIACGEVSADTPVCDEAAGRCVQCNASDKGACTGSTPICDVAASMCTGCTMHSQCPDSACQMDTGACFGTALFVDKGADCASADGTKDLPYCEIGEATAKLTAEPTAILVKPSPSPYTQQVQIAAGRTVAIIRNGNGTARIEVSGSDAVFVSDGATLRLESLQISKGEVTKGLFCTGAAVVLDKTQVIDRKGLGIEAVDCDLTLRESRVWLNLGGGIKVNGGELRLENSFVVTNGGSFTAISGIVISNGATIDAVYSTIADNDGKAGVEDSLDCTNAGVVALRNSIVFGQSAASSVDCVDATATTSVVDSTMLTGEGNMTLPGLDPAWFVDPETGNFSVKAGAPFENVAIWLTGDPTGDYNGDARPGRDGAKDYAGADRPM
jgi:hypothetical protein